MALDFKSLFDTGKINHSFVAGDFSLCALASRLLWQPMKPREAFPQHYIIYTSGGWES